MDLRSCFNRAAKKLSSLISSPSEPSVLFTSQTPDGNLKQLDATMHRLQALIRDFEEKESSTFTRTAMHTEGLRLKELKDVVYDADDVMDEYAYHVLRARIQALDEAGGSNRKRKHENHKQVSIPKELIEKAMKIMDEFQHINNQWDNLRLWETEGDMKNGVDKMKIVPTSSLLNDADIFGREDDKEKIVEMIFAENTELCTVSVLPIVGMAGIGKTTLAQLVYNDSRVCGNFQLQGWVFVGGNFDVQTLTKKIIVTFTGRCCELTELNELHKILEEVVRGKKFFLVLDDVSNDTTRAWGTLLAPLVGALSGRIVVTAHDKQVAKIRQTKSPYSLGYLPNEASWSLFNQLVFEGKDQVPELLEIGNSIVKKCKGLPLAVKAIGTTLLLENDLEKWNEILTSDLWELGEPEDEAIGNLIQLRYLILTNTGIKQLPEAICDLLNLQTLDLMGCPVQEFPKGIKNLIKLRHLSFERSHYLCMPRGIGRLKALRTLSRFDVGKDSWHCKLSELHELANLEGELYIGGLENAVSAEESKKADLQGKKVNILRLDWSSREPGHCKHDATSGCITGESSYELPDGVDSEIHNHIFQKFKPNSTVKELHIHKFCGSVFPSWLGDASFTNLVKLSLVGARKCKFLPSLGHLRSLKTLFIRSMWSVEQVGSDFCYYGEFIGFPSLEYLEFFDMLNWVEWFGVDYTEFDSLSTLRIIDCPKLANLPEPFSSSLTKLVMKDCGKLVKLPALTSLTSLTLKGKLNERVFSFLDFPSLRTLKICYSSNIRSIGISYRELFLLEVLVIHSCRNLQLVSGFTGLKTLKIFKICTCCKVKFDRDEEIPPSVQHLDISDCPMLKGWEQFHKRKLIVQLNSDRGAEYEELEARAELSEAESEDDSDADDSQ
ncbi:hypothetical protein LUZ60_005442 [Juncus effusus]|nr:hypothetical protein LUZ60_005442 [Juncus effusus]